VNRAAFWVLVVAGVVALVFVAVKLSPRVLAALGAGAAGALTTKRGRKIASKLAHAETAAAASDHRHAEETSLLLAARAKSDEERDAYEAEAAIRRARAEDYERRAQEIRERNGW